jgi:hypothetical protein
MVPLGHPLASVNGSLQRGLRRRCSRRLADVLRPWCRRVTDGQRGAG